MRVVLPVMFVKANSLDKYNGGLKLEVTDYESKHMVFYTIDNIEPLDNDMCLVSSGELGYRVALSMKEVDKKIMHQRRTMYYGGGN